MKTEQSNYERVARDNKARETGENIPKHPEQHVNQRPSILHPQPPVHVPLRKRAARRDVCRKHGGVPRRDDGPPREGPAAPHLVVAGDGLEV